MIACRFRHSTEGNSCGCTSPDWIHGGRVPLSLCDICHYHEPPALRGLGDVVERVLTSVGITKKRVTNVTGKPCACSARQNKLNQLIPFNGPDEPPVDDEPLQFVWCYFDKPAKLDELRFSIRSVLQNYGGKAKITIVGDNPDWYQGHRIEHDRQPRGRGFERGLSDVLSKMSLISDHPEIDSEFVWMMDDLFMVKPTSRQQLKKGRAAGLIRSSRRNRWARIKSETAERLRRLDLPRRDFGTHLCHYIEKHKLASIFETWNPHTELFLWEVVYGNTYHAKPLKHDPFLRRTAKRESAATYDRWATESHFLNIYSQAWCVAFRDWLSDKFPTEADHEVGLQYAKGFA